MQSLKVSDKSKGASQMQYLQSLLLSRPFLERVPEQDLIEENYPGASKMMATRGEEYAFIYNPYGLPMQIKTGLLPGETIKAQWFDPRTGTYIQIGNIKNINSLVFTPPSSGRGDDWVLVLDSE